MYRQPYISVLQTHHKRICLLSSFGKLGTPTILSRLAEQRPDVERFAKLPSRFGFAISYTDSAANLRYYEPDFVVVTAEGIHHLVETKGREDIDVRHKDRAAQLWCENATALTGTEWQYKKVLQKGFEELQPNDFEDLITLEPVTLR